MIKVNRNEILDRTAFARIITISAMSHIEKRTEKKYPKPDSPTNCLSNKAAIIEVNPNPKIAESSISIDCIRFALPNALGIAIKANG